MNLNYEITEKSQTELIFLSEHFKMNANHVLDLLIQTAYKSFVETTTEDTDEKEILSE